MAKTNITENGVHQINKGSGTSVTIVHISGTVGAASLQFAVSDGDGGLIAMQDGAITVPNEYKIQHGVDMPVYIEVTSADGSTDLNVITSPFRA